jgi:starch synthase (maltosyl-transferring)
MYAGYELYEHRRFKEGGEEYIDSEKYEIEVRDWDGAAKKKLTLAPFITQLNTIRKKNIALQRLRNLRFHTTENESIIAYSKRDGDNLILVVINLDPSFAQETTVHWNMADLGLQHENFEVTDLIDGTSYNWSAHTYVRLDPTRLSGKVVHIAQVKL